MLNLSAQTILPIACLLLLLLAAITDLAWRIIPNRIPVLVGGIGLLTQYIAGTERAGLMRATIVLVICLLLWWLRIIGGGDAKLLPAVALCVPQTQTLALYMAITFAGAALGLVYLGLRPLLRNRPISPPSGRAVARWRRALRVERWRIGHGGPLPYGVAIAAGAMFVIL